ncbi:MAG: DUF2851 family protein [Bacteroidota bacterium]
MKEDLLYYIWAFQQFKPKKLKTANGMPIKIVNKGTRNNHAGPDFLEATLCLNGKVHRGSIEMHVKSSDWYAHAHQKDPAYKNVILHVVWEHNKLVQVDNRVVPTLVLSGYVASSLLGRYQMLMEAQHPIACRAQLPLITQAQWQKVAKRALVQKLNSRYNKIAGWLARYNNDSEEATYRALAYNFGFNVNSTPFLALSEKVPLKLVYKYNNDLLCLEALFFGQAGFLSEVPRKCAYLSLLVARYTYLKKRHKLPTPLARSSWHFFRLRPANFPTIRIAQFAAFLHKKTSLFHTMMHYPYQKSYKDMTLKQSAYWQKHYLIGKQAQQPIPGLGKSSLHNILINTTVPLLVAYGKIRGDVVYIRKAMALLRQLPPERNKLTKQWEALGISMKNALETQGGIALLKQLCASKKCLSCGIGQTIIAGDDLSKVKPVPKPCATTSSLPALPTYKHMPVKISKLEQKVQALLKTFHYTGTCQLSLKR